MMLIPLEISEGTYNLFVILEDENLKRMRENDPAQVEFHRLPPTWQRMQLRMVVICTPMPEDLTIAMGHVRAGDTKKGVQHLIRGFKFDPTRGDNDDPYTGFTGAKRSV